MLEDIIGQLQSFFFNLISYRLAKGCGREDAQSVTKPPPVTLLERLPC